MISAMRSWAELECIGQTVSTARPRANKIPLARKTTFSPTCFPKDSGNVDKSQFSLDSDTEQKNTHDPIFEADIPAHRNCMLSGRPANVIQATLMAEILIPSDVSSIDCRNSSVVQLFFSKDRI